MYYFLAFVLIVGGFVANHFRKSIIKQNANRQPVSGSMGQTIMPDPRPVPPGFIPKVAWALGTVSLSVGLFFSVFFYAEPGYMYHVRDIFGNEKMVDDVGFNTYTFGRKNTWKKSMSIVAKSQYAGVNEDNTEAEVENDNMTSSILGPVRTIFLDQVDAQISATARFMMPNDQESFLQIARQYRSPDNLIRTTLLPAFRETLQANAALMGAEDYFAGKRTEFNIDFEAQLKDGLYLVKRKEVVQKAPQNSGPASANASLETGQTKFGDEDKVVFVVEKILDSSGRPVRKEQSYAKLGISVVESRITDVVPNAKFNERMQLKQKASADRAIAREQRIQEEEQKLLAEAKGEREVAEEKAAALKAQIKQTTDAETVKQLAITKANQALEQAEIEKATAAEILERDKIKAQSVKVLADAAAYEREALIEADNALQQKLDTEVRIQQVWAEAFSKRSVPSTVFMTGGADGTTPTGSNTELSQIMSLMTLQLADRLDYTRDVKEGK